MPAFYYLAYLIVSVLVAYFVYRAHVRLVEKRVVDELSGSGAPVDLGLGALIGLVLVAVTVIFLWAFGSYAVLGVNSLAVIFVSLANDGAGGSCRR